jgi:hypothetical protein
MRTFACSMMVLCCITGFAIADDDVSPDTQPANVATDATDKTVTVDGRELVLAYVGEADGDTIQEFIPSDETLETWTRLAAIREYPELKNPLEVAEAVVKQLEARNPPANYEMMRNAKNGDVVLSFTVWPQDASFAEFNVFQYCQQPEAGLVSYQYAARAYGDEAESFVKSLDSDTRTMFLVDALEFAVSQGKQGAAQNASDEVDGQQVQHFVPINAKSSDSTNDDAPSDEEQSN